MLNVDNPGALSYKKYGRAAASSVVTSLSVIRAIYEKEGEVKIEPSVVWL